MDHFIHYLKRRIGGENKGASRQNISNDRHFYAAAPQRFNAAFHRPEFHVTRQSGGPARSVTAGSTIWIFSVIESPWGKLGPALDAKIVVSSVRKQDDGLTRFYASDSSAWFPLQDASGLLASLESVDEKGSVAPVWPNRSKPPGLYLQSLRRLHRAERLEEWSDKLTGGDINFISYRIKDGTQQAFRHARKLFDESAIVYWDRFCLPSRLVERRENVSGNALNETLMLFVGRSSKVWGIETPLYTEPGCYAQKEAARAKALNKYVPVCVPVTGH